MQHRRGKAAVIGACLLALSIGGCAVADGAFPGLGRIPAMDERLTTREHRDEIRAMRAEQETHDKDAVEQIEER